MKTNLIILTSMFLLILHEHGPVLAAKGGRGAKAGDESRPSTKKCRLRVGNYDRTREPKNVAVAYFHGNNKLFARVTGDITFKTHDYVSPVHITINLKGLLKRQKAGIFITQNGRHYCSRAGTHFNPLNKNHGPSAGCNRHIGDMEAVQADENGEVRGAIQYDAFIHLQGFTSIIGHTVVVLMHESDNEVENAYRIACGVIGYARGTSYNAGKYEWASVEDVEFIWSPLLSMMIGAIIYYIAHLMGAYKKYQEEYKFTDKRVSWYHAGIVQTQRRTPMRSR